MKKYASAVLVVLLATAACGSPPDIPFAEPDAAGTPVHFAWLEHNLPLSRADLNEVTADNLEELTQEQVDQLYSRLTAGPIPDGPYDGGFFLPRGASDTRFGEIVGGGVAGGIKRRAANLGVFNLEFVGQLIWGGKYFLRDEMLLRNRIRALRSINLLLDEGQEAELEQRYDEELGQYLLFPARLYCGQSLLDARRESIIIDYAYTDTIDGYFDPVDHLGGREGLKIRDEIRMVRPGLYLGRAYLNRVFGLNFVVSNEDVSEAQRADWLAGAAMAEDCWAGEQRRADGDE